MTPFTVAASITKVEFSQKLKQACNKNDSLLCIGLDPNPNLMPEDIGVFEFNRQIIEATSDLVIGYKLNFAFYEALGDDGWKVMKKTVEAIPEGLLSIADAKRADVPNSATFYARAIFSLGFDSLTVNPYLGQDSIEPFTSYKEKGTFLLCRTSNPGSRDIQEIKTPEGKLFEFIARKAGEWNKYGNIGLVCGATCPEDLELVRQIQPDMPILVPGVGAQGGDLKLTLRYGLNKEGQGLIITSSRQVIYASREKNFALKARQVAANLRESINGIRYSRNR